MHKLLILVGVAGLCSATAALWLLGRRRSNRELFAGLVTAAATLSLFTVLAWAATVIVRTVPVPLTWALVGTLAVVFALRLYRELQDSPPSEPR